MNHNKDKPVKFLQIWVMPNKKNVTPRYDQITLDPANRINTLQQVLSPNADDVGVWIHQDAWFHIGKFNLDFATNYKVKKAGNGMYAFVLYGAFELAGQKLEQRDALGITDFDQFELKALTKDAEILLMEIPMQLS
jgi:redox-sensitive bicupin YhaK (pirin superfamily)